ncbi:hypothetical protein FE249_18705 (plasmid) [Acidiphilium multivorum]|uniref:hypothetical protein n=1 Tax=Acidiphilium multivorum TaxID=62140 RepID=UPI001F4C3828|nr:hypothetical protein [Acidiphilium multivorum]UNC16248.1 hypothetical protein FE249_18705 [Acidiphilium multivorum]
MKEIENAAYESVAKIYEDRGVSLGLEPRSFVDLGTGPDGFDGDLVKARLGLTGLHGGELLSFGRVETPENYRAVIAVCEDAFEHATGREIVEPVIGGARIDYGISPVARIGTRIIGAYLLARRSHPKIEKALLAAGLSSERAANGCDGVALALDSAWRGIGIGHMWRRLPRRMNAFDYVFGVQHVRLRNIEDWMKRRVLVSEVPGCYITAEGLKEDVADILQDAFGANHPGHVLGEVEAIDPSGECDEPDLTDLIDLPA